MHQEDFQNRGSDSGNTTSLVIEADSKRRSAKILELFNGFDKNSSYLLDEIYSETVVFRDPLTSLGGLDALKHYFETMYQNVSSISFEITDEVIENDTHVVFWTMTLSATKLGKGKPSNTHGNSIIRFGEDEKITFHRDYFDLGEMIYRHVPILGYAVKKVNERLSCH